MYVKAFFYIVYRVYGGNCYNQTRRWLEWEGMFVKKTPLFEYEIPTLHRKRPVNWDENPHTTR